MIEEIIVVSNYPNQRSNTWGGRYICVHLFLSYPLEINRHPLSMAFHDLRYYDQITLPLFKVLNTSYNHNEESIKTPC
jgi:hypothetical protein